MLKLLADTLKAPMRYRTRHGFGVHSPFAYRLITEVYGERYYYYAYSGMPDVAADYSRKLRLLLRLAVRFHKMPYVFVGNTGSEAFAMFAMADSGKEIAVNPDVVPEGCFVVVESGDYPAGVADGVFFFLEGGMDVPPERGCMIFRSRGTVLVVRRADFPGQMFSF